MKRLLISVLALCAILLSGCADSAAEAQATLSSGGDYVGKLPDGRELRRFRLNGPGGSAHYIYVVNGSVSEAYASGKTPTNVALIDSH